MQFVRLLLLAGLMAGTSSAFAAIITFSDWMDTETPTADYTLTIDDNTPGRFTFNASVDDGYSGSMLAIGFGTTSGFNYTSANLGLLPDTYTTAFDTLVCNPNQGCNFNGTGLGAFDVIVRFAAQGAGVSTVSFSINQLAGMTLADFNVVGIRAQDTGPNGGRLDSDKVWSTTPTTPPVGVPEPGSLALLGAGLLGIGMLRRRKR